jgi:hypothetical protein
MARIRSIKPELLEDEKVARLTHLEYRVFVSSFLLADDYGNFRAAPERIHGSVLWAHPREGLAKALERLAIVGLLVFYMVADQLYVHIAGWEKHQKVDHPGKPLCPALTPDSRLSREALARILDPLAPDLDQDHDLGSGPLLSLPPKQSDPDQTRADSEPHASVPLTGHSLRKIFADVRSRFVGGFTWQTPAVAGGKDATMAEIINADPAARADVVPTIELLFKLAKEGKAGDKSQEILDDGSFAFGTWCSKWASLRGRVHGKTTSAASTFVPRPFPSAAKAGA